MTRRIPTAAEMDHERQRAKEVIERLEKELEVSKSFNKLEEKERDYEHLRNYLSGKSR